ncbi:hypothetical protein P7L78_06230 [Tistrella bauzanensis]|jgi:hypothetical protein|uniref:Uncharacterized protein n=1 Tax=Tistrella arctica TaxID=3133430 RepID=A0ABU9YFP1_9PROT
MESRDGSGEAHGRDIPIERQLALGAAPVVLVNPFTLDAADEDRFLGACPSSAVATPHLFQKVGAGGIRTA